MKAQEIKESLQPKPHIRELTLANGMSYPSNEELIMLILGKGTARMNIEKLSSKVISVINESSTENLIQNLTAIDGIGTSRALSIAAAIELGDRRHRTTKSAIKTPSDIIPYVKHFALEKREHFITVTANGSNEILSIRVISVGTINRTLIHPREVFAEALKEHASAIICCHNHPYGPCFPSKADIETTRILQKSAAILGISFLDHIIINEESFFSFLEHGMLSNS